MIEKFKRIIPRLDVKGENVVKGIQMEGFRVLGDPEEFAKFYYDEGADEIIFSDIVASLYGRNNLKEVVNRTSKNIFIPLIVGGGIRTLANINDLLRAGADKIFLNSAAIKNPNFINEAVKEFGSSTITISVEVNFINNKYEVFFNNGREQANLEALNWVKECQDRGAGEILLSAIHRDGTGIGFDNNLIDYISNIIKIPLIVQSGAGTLRDIKLICSKKNIDGIVLSSTLHYTKLMNQKNTINKKFFLSGNIEFLKNKRNFLNFEKINIKKIKKSISK